MAAIVFLKTSLNGEDVVFQKAFKSFAESTPPVILHLAGWNKLDANSGANILPSDDPITQGPAFQFLSWVRMVVATNWLPAEDLSVTCSKAEFEGRDVVHAGWVTNGFKIEVSQTASIFLAKLTPTNALARKLSQQEALKQMRELTLQFFRKTGAQHSAQGDASIVTNLNLIIADGSLNEKRVQQYEKEGVLLGIPLVETNNQPMVASSDVWFRQVRCWSDGRSVVFYFHKRPFGPLLIPQGFYPSGPDLNWFKD